MKNIILLFVLLMVAGCKKSKNDDPNDYVHLTSQQVIDSVHFYYEKKYVTYTPDPISYSNDTLIFHSDNSVTEKISSDSVVFLPTIIAYDSSLHYPQEPAGVYNRYLIMIYTSPITVLHPGSAGLYPVFNAAKSNPVIVGRINDTLGIVGNVRLMVVK